MPARLDLRSALPEWTAESGKSNLGRAEIGKLQDLFAFPAPSASVA